MRLRPFRSDGLGRAAPSVPTRAAALRHECGHDTVEKLPIVKSLLRQGHEIGRGLVNYSHQEVSKILGCHSEAIAQILGYEGPDTVIHRDNLVINN